MPDNSSTAIGYVLCDDLIFTSRITGTAQALELAMKPARSVATLKSLVGQQSPRCIILDLATAGSELADLVGFLREKNANLPRLVAYGSHVDTATLQAARSLGCDPVLPRSRFVEELPVALPQWMAAEDPRPA